jgi:hypothetical protein
MKYSLFHVFARAAFSVALAATAHASDFSQQYPGTWSDAANKSLSMALAKNGARDCGEYYYRKAATGGGEFLVYCTPNGRTWSAYLVWLPSGNVMGPYKPSTDLAPPSR